MATKPKVANYEQPAYSSNYQGQINTALDKVVNAEKFTYDPLKDANYQAMAKLYQKQGEQAAKNTMGDAASLNGGYGSSYAVTAAAQARNDYNQQLASQIPALQEAAYNRYLNDYNMNVTALSALRDADDSDYGRYRDTVSDSQWKYGVDYQGYRDDVSDSQWLKNYNRDVYESDRAYKYQKSRDKVADSQWAKEYALQKKSVAASRGSSSGGGGYYLGSGSNSSDYSGFDSLWNSSGKSNTTASKTAKETVTKGYNALSTLQKKRNKSSLTKKMGSINGGRLK